jgi:hypothetical protein
MILGKPKIVAHFSFQNILDDGDKRKPHFHLIEKLLNAIGSETELSKFK